MRRIALAVVAATVLTALPGLVDDASAKRPPPCRERSWTGGTTEWCRGVFVYRDYVYDDYGADTGGSSPHGAGVISPTAGDIDHTEHGQHINSADLLSLRLWRAGDALVARFELNTLIDDSDATIAAIALDTDADATTGGGQWEGVEVASTGWERVHVFGDGPGERDLASNVIEGRLPMPAGRSFGVQAVVALGDGTPMNVAFRPGETGDWWDSQQAAALADGDVSRFAVVVKTADFGARHEPARVSTGYQLRVLRSDHEIGEGVVYGDGVTYEGSTASYHFLGRHQPYALFVPPPADAAPYQAMLLLHGAGSAHSAVIKAAAAQQRLGADLDRILISPLSRGFSNSYVNEGARDALDSLGDVEAHWPVDPDRVFVSGYSMGGGGALQLSTWFPDRWAGVIDWVGFTGDCLNGTPLAQGRQRLPGADAFGDLHDHFTNDAGRRSGCPEGARGNAADYLDNLRHVPSVHLFAAADELVWVNHALHVRDRLADLGYEHLWSLHAAEHFTFAVLGDWRKEAAYTKDLVRVRHPARVTYRTNAFLSVPRLDLVPDGAYWVDEITPRDRSATPAGDAAVDLVSHACTEGHTQDVELQPRAGVDPVPWIGQEGVETGVEVADPAVKLSGTVTNVASLLVDVESACFPAGTTGGDIDVSAIVSDGPTELRFDDGTAVTIGA